MRILTASTAAIAAAADAPGGTASAQSVDEIVAKHIAARGGYDKIKAIQSMKITRTVATPFTSVKVVVFKKRSALVRFERTPAGQTTTNARGIDADRPGIPGPEAISPPAPPSRPEAREIDADFDGLLVDWKEKGHTVTLEGKEQMTGWEGYKLKVTTTSGVDPGDLHRHDATYLDRRHTGTVTLPLAAQCAQRARSPVSTTSCRISATGKRSTA